MSILITRPNADNVVELEDDRDYVMLDAAWEWDRSRYIIPVDSENPPADWAAFLRQFVRRDEALTIEQVTFL